MKKVPPKALSLSPSTQTRATQRPDDCISPKTPFERKLEDMRTNVEFLTRSATKPKSKVSLWPLIT